MDDWTRHFAALEKILHSPISKNHIAKAVFEAAKEEKTMKNLFKIHTSGSRGLFRNAFCDEEEIHFETPNGPTNSLNKYGFYQPPEFHCQTLYPSSEPSADDNFNQISSLKSHVALNDDSVHFNLNQLWTLV